MSLLRVCRIAAGWSQAQLGAEARVARETVSLIETGKHAPQLRTAVALSRALGVEDPRLLFPEAFAAALDENNEGRQVATPDAPETAVGVGRPRAEE